MLCEVWQLEKHVTCFGATERDQIWVSPEALARLHRVEICQRFMNHDTLMAELRLPCGPACMLTWPRPSQIDWPDAPMDYQKNTKCKAEMDPLDSNKSYATWAADFEKGAGSLFQDQGGLPSRCTGRGQRLSPELVPCTAPVLRASRPGEIKLAHDLVGHSVRLWFQQARRLQSLKFAIAAGILRLHLDTEFHYGHPFCGLGALLEASELGGRIKRFSPLMSHLSFHKVFPAKKKSTSFLRSLCFTFGNLKDSISMLEVNNFKPNMNNLPGTFSKTSSRSEKIHLKFFGMTLSLRSLTSALRQARFDLSRHLSLCRGNSGFTMMIVQFC